MNGTPISELNHPIVLISPQTGATLTSQAFTMKEAEHVSIVTIFGAEGGSPAAVPTSIVLNQCTSAAGANPTALAFRYYYQATAGAGHDVLDGNQQGASNTVANGPNWATASGITSFPVSVAGLQFIIELDAAELEAITGAVGPQTEYPYLQLVVTQNASSYACVYAVLSGLRHAEKGGYTMTT
jgi:hypothetical protein